MVKDVKLMPKTGYWDNPFGIIFSPKYFIYPEPQNAKFFS